MAFTPLSNSNREISSNFYDIPLPLLNKNKVFLIDLFDLSMRYCFWYQTKYKDSRMFQGSIDNDVMKQDSSRNQKLHACILTYRSKVFILNLLWPISSLWRSKGLLACILVKMIQSFQCSRLTFFFIYLDPND
jgi:hypothetical protein